MTKLQDDYDENQCWGMVAAIDLYGCHPRFLSNPTKIRQLIIVLCKKIGMKRFGPALIERFAEGPLEGYSAMQFIETSSITMHFDEGKNRAFIDIFSCKFFDHRLAAKSCQKFLRASRAKTKYYFRY